MNMGDGSTGYLVVCSYAIALLDLLSAVLFASISAMLYAEHHHWTTLVALIFSIVWICIIIDLFLGIYWRRLSFVRFWLVFTCLGIMLDTLLLLYGLTLAVSINWEGVKVTVMPFVGLAVEMTFVYIVYVFYVDMVEQELWIPLAESGYSGGYVANSLPSQPKERGEERRKFPKRKGRIGREEHRGRRQY